MDTAVMCNLLGCLTEFYLIIKGKRWPQTIQQLMINAFSSVLDAEEAPGATAVNCGNYQIHNFEIAKYYAKEFVDYLAANKDNNDIYEYPKTKRLMTDEGQQFLIRRVFCKPIISLQEMEVSR